MTDSNAALLALGDQIQQAIDDSGVEVAAFVVCAVDGTVEFRSRYDLDETHVQLRRAVDAQ